MYFWNHTRYVILILSTICLTLMFSNNISFNFTIICMDDVKSRFTFNTNNETSHWLSSPSHVHALFSASAVGSLIGIVPVPYLIQKIGIRGTMTIYGLLTAFATLALHIAIYTSYVFVFVLRMLQGTVMSFAFPSNQIVSQWSTTRAFGTYLSIFSTYTQLCFIFTMPLSGLLCNSSVGWPAVFYLLGLLSLGVFSFFFYFYKDDPREHRNVSPEELVEIIADKEGEEKQNAPYRAIAKDSCIVGIWLSAMGDAIGFHTFLIYGPTYLNKVLQYNVETTGFATALPYVLSIITKLITGPISDVATCISCRWRVIIFNTISQGGMALGFISLAFTRRPALAQGIYTAIIVCSGINTVGIYKCAQMVARQHVHVVMAVIPVLTYVVMFLIPVVVNVICADNTPEQWSHLFIGVSVLIIATNIPFLFVARTDPAPWTGNLSSRKITTDEDDESSSSLLSKRATDEDRLTQEDAGITSSRESQPNWKMDQLNTPSRKCEPRGRI